MSALPELDVPLRPAARRPRLYRLHLLPAGPFTSVQEGNPESHVWRTVRGERLAVPAPATQAPTISPSCVVPAGALASSRVSSLANRPTTGPCDLSHCLLGRNVLFQKRLG